MINKIKAQHGKKKVMASQGIPGPKGGDSCGTAMVVGRHLDPKPPTADGEKRYNMKWRTYEIVKGRATATVINSWKGEAFLMISLYLDTRDGDGPINRGILLEVAMKIEKLGLPL